MYKILSVLGDGNEVVTRYYIDILRKAIERKGERVVYIKELKQTNKKDIVIVPTVVEALQLLIKGRKNVIVWMQGVLPEESYMKHKNKLRKNVLEFIERYVLRRAKFIFFVSNKMKIHYENKYNIDFTGRYFVMPCFNTELNKESFYPLDKYKKNIFTYVGSLSVWQCFEETIEIYKMIEKIFSCELRVYTVEIEKAKKILKEAGVVNYSVKYVTSDKLVDELKDVKYGFVIREDNIVNQVATPTKISTYLSAGVIPIFSKCIEDFNVLANKMKYVIPLEDKGNIRKIEEFIQKNIKPNEIYNEYQSIFDTYFSEEKYIEKISKII